MNKKKPLVPPAEIETTSASSEPPAQENHLVEEKPAYNLLPAPARPFDFSEIKAPTELEAEPFDADTAEEERSVIELAKKLKDAKAKHDKKAMTKRLLGEFDDIFAGRELYYVQQIDKIYEYNRNWKGHPWVFYDVRAFCNEHPSLSTQSGRTALMQWLKQKGSYKQMHTYSFADQDATVLNHMRRSHWIKPKDGTPHEMYDVLMRALGGGTQEGADHIEQLLVWKYLNPGDFLLCCVNWFDEGGVGKNLFVDGILGAIFGQEQVASVGLENLTGSFNSIIKGKTVVMMNEAANRKVDMEKLKNLIGQPTLTINEKGIPQYQSDNTPLYFIATNDAMSLPVEGKNSDRRWSIIQLENSIEHFVARHLKVPEAEAKRLWVDQIADELKDPERLSVWLGHLLEKWEGISRPAPMHGEAYDRAIALKNEMNPLTAALSLLEDVNTWVPAMDLYSPYIVCRVQEVPGRAAEHDPQKEYAVRIPD